MDLSEIKAVLAPFSRDFAAVHGENLVCLALYGSAVEGGYIPKKSNLNVIAVFNRMSFEVLKRTVPVLEKGLNKSVLAPVMVTGDYLKTSMDVFPVEYLAIREAHELLQGRDALKDLEISKEHVRRECEEMVKGLLVRLRSSYLECARDSKALSRLLVEAVPALMPVFKALVWKQGVPYPKGPELTVNQAGLVLGFDEHLLSQLLAIRNGRSPALGPDLVLAHLLDELAALAEAVDKGEKINRR